MSRSVPIFIEFALTLEELKSYVECRNYSIRARFGDIFAVKFKDPNEILAQSLSRLVQRNRKKKKARYGHSKPESSLESSKQTVTIESTIESLVSDMRKYPVELSLYNKDDPHFLGLAEVPWSPEHIDYISNLLSDQVKLPLLVKGKHTVFDEYTSRRVAVLKLTIRVAKVTDPQVLIQKTHCDLPVETGTIKTIYFGGKNRNPQKDKPVSRQKNEITGISKNNNNKYNNNKLETVVELDSVNTNPSSSSQSTIIEQSRMEKVVSCVPSFHKNNLFDRSVSSLILNKKASNKISGLVRSQTDMGRSTKLFAITKHWSSSSVEVKERLDTLNYIFGNLDGPFGNQVYCVGYFTVSNDNDIKDEESKESKEASQTDKTDKSSSSRKIDFEFPICDSKCGFIEKNPCFENVITTDLPEEARHLINVKKCTELVDCEYTREREQKDPIEPILLDFTNVHNECCVQKIEEVTGGVHAKMKVLDDPCYCTCECTFGFIKKTMYCNVCGGYEVAGDEMQGPQGMDPFPCPVYFKAKALEKERAKEIKEAKEAAEKAGEPIPVIVDEGPVDFMKEATQALVKEKAVSKDQKAIRLKREKEEEKKNEIEDKKKLKIDPRFQFNYGYKAPKIGHKHCFEPCGGGGGGGGAAGTRGGNVPKGMGWLWTATNVPGLPKMLKYGWKPGCISKSLLRKLNQAKIQNVDESEGIKRTRRTRKREEDKATLIIKKKSGQYTVEMQVEDKKEGNEHCKPLIYKIQRQDNEERIQRRERKAQRLISQTAKEVFTDPYHPQVCEQTCLKAFKQAMGVPPYNPNVPQCICPEDMEDEIEEIVSEESSDDESDDDLDLDWEIHFTPPISCHY